MPLPSSAARITGRSDPAGIEDRVQILHPRFKGRELTSVIRDPGSPLVEQDEAEGIGRPQVESRTRGVSHP